jgi:hypothetical protein
VIKNVLPDETNHELLAVGLEEAVEPPGVWMNPSVQPNGSRVSERLMDNVEQPILIRSILEDTKRWLNVISPITSKA